MDIILLANLVKCGISTPEKFYEKKRKNITHGYHTYDGGVDSPSRALIKKKNNLQNNLTLQRKQNLVFHQVKKASEVISDGKTFCELLCQFEEIFRKLYPPLSSFFGKRTDQTEHSN